MSVLPAIADSGKFGKLLADADAWLPVVALLREKHDLDEEFTQSSIGSVAVFLSRSWCIKLHPPLAADLESCELEVAVLRHLNRDGAARLPVATPAIVAEGTVEGWAYFVATRLPGEPIEDVWPTTPPTVRVELARQLGECVRAMHDLPLESLVRFAIPWKAFRDEQRGRCLDQESDLEPARMAELEAFLELGDDRPAPEFEPALLHTELGPGHVLVQDGTISGLIDFGDAMIGDPEYDFAAVGLFVTRGDKRAFSAFSQSYGGNADPVERASRTLRHALLHKYGTLSWYLKMLEPPALPLAELADHWFGVAAAPN